MHFWARKWQKWMEITETKTCSTIISIIYSLTKNGGDNWQADKFYDITTVILGKRSPNSSFFFVNFVLNDCTSSIEPNQL